MMKLPALAASLLLAPSLLLLLLLTPTVAGARATAAPEGNLMVTKPVYPSDADHGKICEAHFGPAAVVADFTDLTAIRNATLLQETMSDVGIPVSRFGHHYFIRYFGQSHYPGSTQQAYFFENNGGGTSPPAFFNAVDQYAGISVGVTNKYGNVVCYVGGGEDDRRRRRRDLLLKKPRQQQQHQQQEATYYQQKQQQDEMVKDNNKPELRHVEAEAAQQEEDELWLKQHAEDDPRMAQLFMKRENNRKLEEKKPSVAERLFGSFSWGHQ